MSQLPLDLAFRPALDREAFFVSGSNAEALAQVERWRHWPGGKLAVTGAEGSGKTHLAHVWAAESGAEIVAATQLDEAAPARLADTTALVVEDADRLADLPDPRPAEAALFHLHNMLAARGGHLMVSGRGAPAHWRIETPDLASRLQAAPVATLHAADDALIDAVILKIAADRQLELDPRVPPFLSLRLDRALGAISDAMARLDRQALAAQRRITVPFARDVLGL